MCINLASQTIGSNFLVTIRKAEKVAQATEIAKFS